MNARPREPGERSPARSDSIARPASRERRKRPFSITLLVEGTLLLAGLHLVRFYQALKQWDFLASLPGISPLYLALTGLAWFLLALGVAIALWRGWRRAPQTLLGLALAFSGYSWIDRVLVAHEEARAWPFLAILNGIIFAWIVFALRRRDARQFFGELPEANHK